MTETCKHDNIKSRVNDNFACHLCLNCGHNILIYDARRVSKQQTQMILKQMKRQV